MSGPQRDPIWNRLAIGSGLDFVVVVAITVALARAKGYAGAGDFATTASDAIWGVYTLLIGLASVLFLSFTSAIAPRVREMERVWTGSGRFAPAVFGAGSIVAGIFALEVAVQFAARRGGQDLAELATSLVEGPVLAFPLAVYIGAIGIVALRSAAKPGTDRWIGALSVAVAVWMLLGAALQIFKNYAWLDETSMLVFLAWVSLTSLNGAFRWNAPAVAPPVPDAAPLKPKPVKPKPVKPAPTPGRVRKPTARKPSSGTS